MMGKIFDRPEKDVLQPQPIEKLFDFPIQNYYVWVKSRNGSIKYGFFDAFKSKLTMLGGVTLNKDLIISSFQSFIIAEIPKF